MTFSLAQGVERNRAQGHSSVHSIEFFSHGSGATLLHDLRREGGGLKVGEQPVKSRVEAQNAVVPQMVEQWLEVPKIMPQDTILQTAKQIADHLDKRGLARAEEKTFSDEWKAQMDRRDRCAVGRVITGEEKFHGEKLKVEECAAKVVGEFQKRMATETGRESA